MKKLVIQGAATILLFIGIWLLFTQIDWMTLFRVQQITDKSEQKLGEILWENFNINDKEVSNTYVVNSVDSIVSQLCLSNNLDRSKFKVHILNNNEVNAFALPDGHLVIYSGLILNSESQDELVGVIGHEMAHIELNHVMKKLGKEIGLSVLISLTTGNSNMQVISEALKVLSSTAFDRNFEREADIKSVDYLINANVNPEPFANFLYKLSHDEHREASYLEWVSTHPDSKERATYILEYSSESVLSYKQILSDDTWLRLKEILQF